MDAGAFARNTQTRGRKEYGGERALVASVLAISRAPFQRELSKHLLRQFEHTKGNTSFSKCHAMRGFAFALSFQFRKHLQRGAVHGGSIWSCIMTLAGLELAIFGSEDQALSIRPQGHLLSCPHVFILLCVLSLAKQSYAVQLFCSKACKHFGA